MPGLHPGVPVVDGFFFIVGLRGEGAAGALLGGSANIAPKSAVTRL